MSETAQAMEARKGQDRDGRYQHGLGEGRADNYRAARRQRGRFGDAPKLLMGLTI